MEEEASRSFTTISAKGGKFVYHQCDVTDFACLRSIMASLPQIDIAIGNAGIDEDSDFLADTLDADGQLQEPPYKIIDVNFRAVLNFTKLSLSAFRRQQPQGGSLVLTASSLAYAPRRQKPIYSATKLAVSCP